MVGMISAITFDFWDTIAVDDSDEPKRAALGLPTKADARVQLFAERIGGVNYGKGTEIYKFEKIKRAKRKALAEHPERKLLDFGIGENDDMADEAVRAALAREANKVDNRGYADNGIQNYKDAAPSS